MSVLPMFIWDTSISPLLNFDQDEYWVGLAVLTGKWCGLLGGKGEGLGTGLRIWT